MRILLEFYELLRNRINLSDIVRQKIVLTKKSANYLGLCPFHSEKTPSFTVNDSKKFYYCFGCSAHGDVIKFVSNVSGLSYKEAAIKLAGDYSITIPKLTAEQQRFYEESDELISILEIAERFFKSQLTKEIYEFLYKRGLNKETIEKFSIGFAPQGKVLQKFFEEKSISWTKLLKAGLLSRREDGTTYDIFYNRIIFPIRNIYDKIIGFSGRTINDGLPKYLNSPETILFQKKEILYGENYTISNAYKSNYSILVEGQLDVISLHQAGFKEAAASLGTAITGNHIQKLWRAGDEIIMCLDGDEAGNKATHRVINLVLPLINNSKKISFITLPPSTDPDNIINKGGATEFKQLLDQRINLSEMIWRFEYEGKIFPTPEDKATLETNLEKYCKQIQDKSLSNNYYRYFKDQIWQNLVKNNNKNHTKNSYIRTSLPECSEIEMLEQIFCLMLVEFPEIINRQEVKDFLLTLDFQNNLFSNFRDWYFDNIINNNIIDKDNIIKLVEKTGFYDTFLVLLKSNNLFLKLSFNRNDIDSYLLWQWLYKKHHLVLLKQEYTSVIHNDSDEELRKASLYREEIMKVSQELSTLNESFTN
ncbi:MAG: DNA primase [Rickettsia endosymbiont of Bryobia graminum]|nr:DNA primase [Rickettsia endosymbiont of Bryobia graminum]